MEYTITFSFREVDAEESYDNSYLSYRSLSLAIDELICEKIDEERLATDSDYRWVSYESVAFEGVKLKKTLHIPEDFEGKEELFLLIEGKLYGDIK